jgi:hypothetical protein
VNRPGGFLRNHGPVRHRSTHPHRLEDAGTAPFGDRWCSGVTTHCAHQNTVDRAHTRTNAHSQALNVWVRLTIDGTTDAALSDLTGNRLDGDGDGKAGGDFQVFVPLEPTGLGALIERDLAPTQLARNQTFFNTLVWVVNRNFQIGFEVDYRKTDYIRFLDAEGVNFMTRFLGKS